MVRSGVDFSGWVMKWQEVEQENRDSKSGKCERERERECDCLMESKCLTIVNLKIINGRAILDFSEGLNARFRKFALHVWWGGSEKVGH